MSVDFETPAERIIRAAKPENEFRIPTDLPDLAFLRRLSIQGRLTYNVVVGTTAALVITPPQGATQFIYKIFLTNRNSNENNTFTITNNGIVRATIIVSADAAVTDSPTQIIPLFDSLVGNSVKTFEVEGNQTEDITILGWIENTSRIREVAI